jgi:hypothetical protein
MTTLNLLSAFKHPVGTPVPFNANIVCMAERIRHMPGIKKGKDYLYHSKRLLESSQMQVKFPMEMSTESIGGREFDVMYTTMSMAGVTIYQKYYVVISKGYALAFIVSFTTAEDESALQDIINTVSFK